MKFIDFVEYDFDHLKEIALYTDYQFTTGDIKKKLNNFFENEYNAEKLKIFSEQTWATIKTPFRSKYGMYILINIYKSSNSPKFKIESIHCSKLTHLAVYYNKIFRELKNRKQSKKYYEAQIKDYEFEFNEFCSNDDLEMINKYDNVVLPTSFINRHNHRLVALFKEKFVNKRKNPFPKKRLVAFQALAFIDENSKLGRFAYIYETDIKDLHEKLTHYNNSKAIAYSFQRNFENLSDSEIDSLKKNIENDGFAYIPFPIISYTGHRINLCFKKNTQRPIDIFGNIPIPPYIAYPFETPVCENECGSKFSNQICFESSKFEELAILTDCKKESSVLSKCFQDYLDKNFPDEELHQANLKPLYVNTPFRSKNNFEIKARIDKNLNHNDQTYLLRYFTCINEESDLAKFATCPVSPFQDLKGMYKGNTDLDEIINDYANRFNNKKISLDPDDYRNDEIIIFEDEIQTSYGSASVYFDKCPYYEGKDTPYILKFFFIPKPYTPDLDDKNLTIGLRSLHRGPSINIEKKHKPDPIEAKFLMSKSKFFKGKESILEYLIQTPKSLIIENKKNQQYQERIAQKERKLKEEKDKLIQQFTHSLRSSLGTAQGFIQKAITKNDTENLKDVIFNLEKIDRNLKLLSLTARKPEQLKEKINISISKTGIGISTIFFNAITSALLFVIENKDYEEFVLKRYLSQLNETETNYFKKFKTLSDEIKKELLDNWKEKQFGFDEEEKNIISSKTWENISEKEFTSIYHKWLKTELAEEIFEIRKKNDIQALKTWLSHYYLPNFNFEYELFFESEHTEGSDFFSWIFSELCLNCLKYSKIDKGELTVSFRKKGNIYIADFFNEISYENRIKYVPGSSAGLDVLKIMIENIDGKFENIKSETKFSVTFQFPEFNTEAI